MTEVTAPARRDEREGVSMSDKRTTARAFHDAGGVDDWRVLPSSQRD